MADTPCHPDATQRPDTSDLPSALLSPDQALAVYRLTSRLVERQLELAEQGQLSPTDADDARDLLVGTREMLLGALRRVDADGAPDGSSLEIIPNGSHGLAPDESTERQFAS